MRNTYSIDIDAPPERTFRLLTDSERAPEWIPNLVESRDVSVEEGGAGSRFHHVYVENGRRMEMDGEVTVYEPSRRLASQLRGGPFDLRVDYRLEDLGGRTRLTQESEVRFKSLPMKVVGALLKPVVRKASLRQLEDSFAKLKRLAESGDG